jgi:MFS family permease
MALAGRTLWLSLLLIPSLPLPPEARVWTFVALFGLAALIQGAISTPWMSWMSDLAPARLRGRFWARRNQFIALVNMGVLLGGGCLIDGAEALGHKLWGYYILVIVAYASGLVSIRLLGRTHEPPMKPAPGGGFLANARRPLRDKTFRRLIPAVATFQLGLGLAGAFVSAYMLKTLDLSYTAIGLYTILGQAAGIAGNWFWGPMLDRVGVKPVTLCCLLFVGIVPFLWVSCDFLGWPMIVFNWLFSGFAWAGFGLGMVNFPFALSPKDGRSYYLSVLGILGGGAFLAGSLLGGLYAEWLGPGRVRVLGLDVVNYQVLLAASGLVRLSSFFLFVRVRDARGGGIGAVVEHTVSIFYLRLIAWTRPGAAEPLDDEDEGTATRRKASPSR